MRVTVGIASRGRPLALTGVVMALDRLKSGKHDVRFVVGADCDDEHLGRMHELWAGSNEGSDVVIRMAERSTLAAVWNRLAGFDKEADVLTLLSDRAFCISPWWDDMLVDGVEKHPDRVMWWSSPEDSDCTMPVVSKKWIAAADYEWCSNLWPFWFSDTENREIDLLVSGKVPLKLAANYAGARATTQSGRDFAFWFSVYSLLRSERIARSKRIAAAFGTEIRLPPEGYFEAWDKEMQDRSPDFEERFGDKHPASAAYLAAKANAEQVVKEYRNGK